MEQCENQVDSAPEDLEEGSENLRGYRLARDRQRRVIKPPARFGHSDMVSYALSIAEELEYQEPRDYREAINSPEKEKWIAAMQEEIDSLLKNGTWVLVDKPRLQKLVGCKWIFKRKIEVTEAGEQVRYKARLVAKGFTQKEGIDFNEVFSPVVKHTSIRILLSMVNQFDMELQQLDVKTAFLNGDLEETIFMAQPECFELPETRDKVYLLKRSLYGLKQSPRQWYLKFDEYMLSLNYSRSQYDSCVYFKRPENGKPIYLLLYVDDMLIASQSKSEVEQLKSDLKIRFEMKDLGSARRILGMDIARNRSKGSLWLTQSDYIEKVVRRFNMNEARSVSVPIAQGVKLTEKGKPQNSEKRAQMSNIPYANGIGSIMYTMVCTRPDLAHCISVLSRFMADPGRQHWESLKWTFRYMNGHKSIGIQFQRVEDSTQDPLMGFVDSDYAANVDSRKSQSGFVFVLYGAAVSWKSSLQSVVALSTTEAEYMAMTEAVKEAMWLKGIMEEFGVEQKSVVIKCDNQSALHLSKHQVFHERSKHIDVRMHFIRDIISKGDVKVEKVHTDHNAADMLTKALPVNKFRHCLDLIGMTS